VSGSSPLPDTAIEVASGLDRPSQRDQIADIIARAREKGEPVRLRLPLSLYNYAANRGYIELRDASWNLKLASDQVTPEAVELIITALHTFVRTLGEVGAQAAMARLLLQPDHE
jgi:hypothetical protein